jgi:hypothetical protein
LAVADDRHSDIRETYVTTINLSATGGAASLLCGDVRTSARFLFVGAETVDEIAEQSAGRITVRLRCSNWLELNQGVPGPYAALEFCLQRIQFFAFLMPHELNVANRAGIVEEKKKVLEEFQILLKFPT